MSLDERILAVQHSGEDPSDILREYMPFITASASRATGRHIGPGDDELSVALSAFQEAIAAYDGSRGGFLYFAGGVIRLRLIDYARRTARHREEVPFSALSTEVDGESRPFEIEDNSQQRSRVLRQEIDALSGALAPFGIGFADLADASPRAAKTRQACAIAVRGSRAVVRRDKASERTVPMTAAAARSKVPTPSGRRRVRSRP
jgi:RNA polymerase sigma factor